MTWEDLKAVREKIGAGDPPGGLSFEDAAALAHYACCAELVVRAAERVRRDARAVRDPYRAEVSAKAMDALVEALDFLEANT